MKKISTRISEISHLSENSNFDKPIKQINRKIYGFYHICCVGSWRKIVNEQITLIKDKRLYDIIDKIYVCILSNNNDDFEYCKKIFPEKFVIIRQENNYKVYEFPILKYLKEKSKKEKFYCFYFHTKGVSTSSKMKGEKYWRYLLDYFLLEKYNIAINALEAGYNTYGILYRNLPNYQVKFFSGNFWFSKSEYIDSLQTFSTINEDRYQAEIWIGKGDINPYVPYDSNLDLYHIPIPRVFYDKKMPIYKNTLCIVLFIFYYIKGHIYHKQYNKHDYII